jgi:hypothetical protein
MLGAKEGVYMSETEDSTTEQFKVNEHVVCKRFTGLPRNFKGTIVKVYDHAVLLKLNVKDFTARYQSTLDDLNDKVVIAKKLVVPTPVV